MVGSSFAALVVCACSPLSLESVEPPIVQAAVAADLTVRGTGFSDGLRLALAAPGLSITLGAVTVIDDTTATARVGASTPAGVFALEAALGDTRATLDDALTVSAQAARLVFVDVGQGDATLVIAPDGETLLIDGGRVESAPRLREVLDEHALGRIDAVVISHFDVDHAGGVVELLAGADGVAGSEDDIVPDDFIVPSGLEACDAQFCDRLRALRATPRIATTGEVLSLGLLTPRVVAVDGVVTGGASVGGVDDNGRSVVLQVEWGGKSALILGDLTGGGLGTVDVEGPLALATGPVDVLRVAHHGSATSSNGVALSTWLPEIAVLSLGTDNPYCHPEPSAFTRVAESSGTVLSTGRGIVDDVARCGGATPSAPNATLGVGDIVVEMGANGALVVR